MLASCCWRLWMLDKITRRELDFDMLSLTQVTNPDLMWLDLWTFDLNQYMSHLAIETSFLSIDFKPVNKRFFTLWQFLHCLQWATGTYTFILAQIISADKLAWQDRMVCVGQKYPVNDAVFLNSANGDRSMIGGLNPSSDYLPKLLFHDPHPYCWGMWGKTAKEKQEPLPCYITTTPGVLCTLIKIHVFRPASHSDGSQVRECRSNSEHPADRACNSDSGRGDGANR